MNQFPRSRPSPTAAQDKAGVKHDLIYSSIVCAQSGASQQKLFTVPQGQTILTMKGSTMTITEAHQTVHTELTTSLEKAGELGSGIGDASVRGISIVFEAAIPLGTAAGLGTYGTYGATPHEIADALSKIYFQFKVGGNVQTQGTLWMFPAAGGLAGAVAVSSTANNTTKVAGIAQNGPMGSFPRKRIPIQIARNDTVAGVVNTGNGASLAHSVTTTPGQPYLLYCVLDALIKGDVRG